MIYSVWMKSKSQRLWRWYSSCKDLRTARNRVKELSQYYKSSVDDVSVWKITGEINSFALHETELQKIAELVECKRLRNKQ